MRITVAILCGPERHQWLNPQLAFWLASGMNRRKDTDVHLLPVYGFVPVEHARNFVADHFLKSNSDWLLMIDNDIAPAPNLLEILDDLKDHVKIVSPITVMWNGKHHAPTVTQAKEEEDYFVPIQKPHRGKNEVSAVGTGCIFIHRDVFKKLVKPYFSFKQDPESRGYIYGEDYGFCKKAKEQGFKVYADSRFICGHFHTLDLAEVNAGWARMIEVAQAQKAKADQKKVELANENEMKQAINDSKQIERLK
jgi:GT2 family glycosyltransferase